MKTLNYKKAFQVLSAVLLMAALFTVNANAQCTNSAQFGSGAVPTVGGVTTTLTTCAFTSEYSMMTGAVAGQTLTVTGTSSIVNPVFLTVHSGTFNGPVVAFGNSPLTFVNTFTGTLFLHYNNNAACGQGGAGCVTGTVTCNSCPGITCNPCTNSSQFGSATISGNALITISTCSFAGEYSPINGAVAGQTLRFTSSVATDCITIHSGSPAGPVIANGQTPLQFVNTFTGTLYAHWNTSSCGSQFTCRTTRVQCISCPAVPANDLICNATLISGCSATPISISGTTVNSTVDAGLPVCGNSIAGGVWYRWTGVTLGFMITLNTCTGTGYDSWISVYTSSNNLCSGVLTCIANNDDFCGLQSQVSFIAPATTLFIRVHGFSTATGAFVLTRSCVSAFNPCIQPIPTVVCTTPQTTTWAGGTGAWTGTMGSPFGTPGQEKLFTFTAPFTGVFRYSQLANGGPSTWVDVFYKPVSSGCSNTGWTFTDDVFWTEGGVIATADLNLTAGITYYILLDPESTGAGSRTWWVDCTPPPNVCNIATPTICNATITSTTVGAAANWNSLGMTFCGTTYSGAPGKLYSIVGNGSPMRANTCNMFTNYDTKLHVFTAASCTGPFTCIGGNDDQGTTCGAAGFGVPGFTSRVQWNSVLGTTYYILVHGFSSFDQGNFGLTVECPGPCAIGTVTSNITAGCGVPLLGQLVLSLSSWSGDLQWQFESPVGSNNWLNIAGATFSPVTLNINAAGQYNLRAQVLGFCTGGPISSNSVPFTLWANPAVPTGPVGLTACGVATGNISATAPPPGLNEPLGSSNSIEWYTTATGGTAIATGNTLAVNETTTTTYFAGNLNSISGCRSATRLAVQVKVLFQPTVTAASNSPVCAGQLINLDATAVSGPACGGGTFTVTLSGAWWRDETTWTLKDASNVTFASGGPYGFGGTQVGTGTSTNGPFTFFIETQGPIGDNQADWTITCDGGPVANGHISANITHSQPGLCCSGSGGGGSSVIYTVTITPGGVPSNWLDMVSWQLISNNNTVIHTQAGGGFGTFPIANVIVQASQEPVSFFIESQGAILDNNPVWNIVCSGNTLSSGSIGPNQTSTVPNLSCAPPPVVPFNWTGPNSFVSNVEDPQVVALAASEGTYAVTFTSSNGCTATASTDVDVDFAPNIVSLQSATLNGGVATSFPSPPSFLDIPAFTEILTCDKVVNYNVAITGEPDPLEAVGGVTYSFNGATLGSGNGTGSGSTFGRLIPTGRTTVTVNATNICGSQTKTFRVTVTDNVAPVITPIQVAATNTNAGECASLVQVTQPDLLNGGLFDNCPNASLIFVSRSDGRSQFEPYFAGTTTITWQATDASANTTIATQDVVVVNIQPVITSFSSSSNIIFVNESATFTTTFTDEDGGGTHTVKFYKDKNDAVPANVKVVGPLCTQLCDGVRSYSVSSDPILFSTSMVSEPKVEVLDGCNTAANQEPGVSTIQYFAVAVPGQQFTTAGGHFTMPAGGHPSAYEGMQVNIGNVVKKATSGNSFKGQLEMNVHIPGLPDWRVHTDNGTNQDITWDYLTIAGCSLATFKGAVRINGQTGYKVLVQQSDKDRNPATSNFMRVKVTTNGGLLVFDTQPGLTEALTSGNGGAAAIITALSGGAIKVQPSNTQNQACTSRMEGLSSEGDMLQNLPNPFNGQTEIRFSIPADGKYTLKVYNYLGQEVSTLFDGEASGGSMHSVMFDGSHHRAGIYTYTLAGANVSETRRMNLVR